MHTTHECVIPTDQTTDERAIIQGARAMHEKFYVQWHRGRCEMKIFTHGKCHLHGIIVTVLRMVQFQKF